MKGYGWVFFEPTSAQCLARLEGACLIYRYEAFQSIELVIDGIAEEFLSRLEEELAIPAGIFALVNH